MAKGESHVVLAFFVVLISMGIFANFVHGQGNGNNNNRPADYAASTNYNVLTPLASGRERAFCKARGKCNSKTLTCPKECPERKPKQNKKKKGCFIDCSSKCEVTCKCKSLLISCFIVL